jgi:hypothetical protein
MELPTPPDISVVVDTSPTDGTPAPRVEIWHPSDGEVGRTARAPIPFVGHATNARGATLSGGALVWTSDRSGPLGSGERISVTLLAGTHRVSLSARDAEGRVGTAFIRLDISP